MHPLILSFHRKCALTIGFGIGKKVVHHRHCTAARRGHTTQARNHSEGDGYSSSSFSPGPQHCSGHHVNLCTRHRSHTSTFARTSGTPVARREAVHHNFVCGVRSAQCTLHTATAHHLLTCDTPPQTHTKTTKNGGESLRNCF